MTRNQALAAFILTGAVAGGSGCGSWQAWYANYDSTRYYDGSHGYRNSGYHGNRTGSIGVFDGGGDDLLVAAIFLGGVLLIEGAIQLGEYAVETCQSWFE